MSLTLFLGYLAGFLTTIAFVPQVIKTWKTKSADDLSLGMFLVFCAGVACWVAYGFLLNAKPIYLWNLATLLLAGAILVMKLKFKGRRAKEPKRSLMKKSTVKDLKDWGI